jgi:P-type E1-E2 ATPase
VFYEVNSVKKYDILLNLKRKGSVVFVGDGINDSIVIKEADVGISFEYGNDLTQNLADVIIKDISYLKELYLISLRTFNKLRFNLFWVFFYNILLIPLAMGVFYNMGIFINPMLASISMSLSSISLLIFNLF